MCVDWACRVCLRVLSLCGVISGASSRAMYVGWQVGKVLIKPSCATMYVCVADDAWRQRRMHLNQDRLHESNMPETLEIDRNPSPETLNPIQP